VFTVAPVGAVRAFRRVKLRHVNKRRRVARLDRQGTAPSDRPSGRFVLISLMDRVTRRRLQQCKCRSLEFNDTSSGEVHYPGIPPGNSRRASFPAKAH